MDIINPIKRFFGIAAVDPSTESSGSVGPGGVGIQVAGGSMPGPLEVLNSPRQALRVANPFRSQTDSYLSPAYISGAMELDSERGGEVSNKEMLATLIADCEKFAIHKLLLSPILVGSGTATLAPVADSELHYSNVVTFTTCKAFDQKAQPIQLTLKYFNNNGVVPNGGQGSGAITVVPTGNTIVAVHRVGFPLSGEFQAETGVLSSAWRGTAGFFDIKVDVSGASALWETQIMLLPTRHPMNRAMMNAASAMQMGEALAALLAARDAAASKKGG